MNTDTSMNALKPTPLFNPQTGVITDDFQRQMDLVGIAVKQTDILNVERTLQKNGCYQSDFDHYKNGGESEFKISYDQATAYLDHIYGNRKQILPEKTSEPVDGILCSGVTAKSIPLTLSKRLKSLKSSLTERNLNYETVFILCKNDEMKGCSSRFIRGLQVVDEIFSQIQFKFVVAGVDRNIGKTCVEKLEREGALKNSYVVITDATSAQKDYLTATTALSKKCHGIALSPILDWKQEMKLYGYDVEALGSHEKAAIAWARSDWNFRSRQVSNELQNFKAKAIS